MAAMSTGLTGSEAAHTVSDATDYDHVPAQAVFAKKDRAPLKLKTHKRCNHGRHLVDEKIGQLIALRRGEAPRPEHRRLRFRRTNMGPGLWNLDVDAAVWRWIAGFHAALYRKPLRVRKTGVPDPPFYRSLVVPFPKAPKATRKLTPVMPQHLRFVATIKVNRFKRNLDRIECNNGQLVYECVWERVVNEDAWRCIFALNVCDWKDLGATKMHRARGCAGVYMLESRTAPADAALAVTSAIILPNRDPLDPFAA